MPVYDYVCSSCGHRFEVFRGLNEAGPHQCPLCEGPVTRAFAPPTIHFKGTGWAKNDRRSSGAPAKKAAGESKSDGAKSGDSKSGESASTSSSPGDSSSGESASTSSSPGD
ncbi:MAG TPA: FmdB family zinc ribbon protein [Candidatus Nanopelagicales bacterium]|nr:FmdB family zinc ribbon protein [Candidatus Nanopelagicales bacterium]